MIPRSDLALLFDVDNTLLDNDRVTSDLAAHLEARFGEASAGRYWEIFEQLRAELGYADYLGALQRYRLVRDHDPRLLGMTFFLTEYPFAERLYQRALETLRVHPEDIPGMFRHYLSQACEQAGLPEPVHQAGQEEQAGAEQNPSQRAHRTRL